MGADKKGHGGFTLAELLITVAIVGILVAISIPIFTTQIHKAEVATDEANLRAYFSVIQADYISTGKYDLGIGELEDYVDSMGSDHITYPDGTVVKLKAGKCYVIQAGKGSVGYQILYFCLKGDGCQLVLGAKN